MPSLETPPNPATDPAPSSPPVKVRTGRFGELEEHEIIHLLDSLDDERAKARFREAIYISVIIYLALGWFVLYGPRVLFHQPRLINPAFMDPTHYEWSKVDGASNVAEKLFAVFSDRGAEARIVRFEADARHALRGRAVYYTLSGKGTVGSEPLRAMSSFYLDAGESVEVAAQGTVEILQLGMPKLSGMTASAGQAAA